MPPLFIVGCDAGLAGGERAPKVETGLEAPKVETDFAGDTFRVLSGAVESVFLFELGEG